MMTGSLRMRMYSTIANSVMMVNTLLLFYDNHNKAITDNSNKCKEI